MNNSRLFVFKLKEIIYLLIVVAIIAILLVILISKFVLNKPSTNNNSSSDISYNPGVYTTQLSLGETLLNVEVTVDNKTVKNLEINNLSESVTVMYPLIEPALESIKSQLNNGTSIDNIEVSEDSKYTQSVVLQSVKDCLEKAKK